MKNIAKIEKWIFLLIGISLLVACDDASLNKSFKRAYHVENINGTEIRCTAMNSTQLPKESLSRHSIKPDPNTGVLSCVAPLADNVTATYRTIGTAQQIMELRREMKHSKQTWLGTYIVTSTFPVQFDITVSRPNVEPVVFEFNTEES